MATSYDIWQPGAHQQAEIWVTEQSIHAPLEMSDWEPDIIEHFEADEDIEAGRVTMFDSMEELIRDLNEPG